MMSGFLMGVEESSESTDEQQVSEQAPDLPTGSTKLFNSSRVHSGTPKEPRAKLYSQLLGRYVPFNTCIACGERGHVARNPQCSLYARNKGKKNNFHTGGQTTPQQRATRFASWLIEAFGLDFLKATGVLDIAGGQGKLSLDLQLRHGISCTVVDPRRIQLSVKQQQIFERKKCNNEIQVLPMQKDDFLDDPDNLSVFQKIGLLVGLHPDQATERIVRFGLKYSKNFAVLPCCVFPKMFPHRKNPDGSVVKYYEEFCDWLQSLDTGIQRATLPIPGRSVILYKIFT